jgi:multiple sugar transport system permease protein
MTDRALSLGGVDAERVGRRRATSTVLHVALIVASIIMLYPILWMFSASVRPASEIFSSTSLFPSSVSFQYFVSGWNTLKVSFGQFAWNSLLIAVLSIIGNLASCSLAAFAFTRLRFPGRNVLFALMLGTLMLPYHVTLIPQYVMFLHLGWVNTMLPLVVPKFLATDAFFIFLMVQFFRGIPRELDEAAMMDGCSPWRIYWRVMLPLSMPVLATAAIFTFLWTWEDFFGPLIYLNDIRTFTVQLGLRSLVDSTGDSQWNSLFAMSVLSLLPVFLFFLVFQRLLIEGIATTGMKR